MRRWRGLMTASAVVMAVALVCALLFSDHDNTFTVLLFRTQDLGWGVLFVLMFFRAMTPDRIPYWNVRTPKLSPRALLMLLTTFVFIVCLAGTWIVFADRGLTRDEDMANFDAAIIASGHVLATVPSVWRAFADALEPEFVNLFSDRSAWASTYLPVNALLRALMSIVARAELTGPLLAAASVAGVYSIARKLWPSRVDAAVIAATLLAVSPQLLLTGMTPYAMTAHLALDIFWLRLFLQDRPAAHAGAIGVGFLATGLHQIIFHPLFAAPFIVQLGLQKRWRLFCAYGVGYALIGLFWI